MFNGAQHLCEEINFTTQLARLQMQKEKLYNWLYCVLSFQSLNDKQKCSVHCFTFLVCSHLEILTYKAHAGK